MEKIRSFLFMLLTPKSLCSFTPPAKDRAKYIKRSLRGLLSPAPPLPPSVAAGNPANLPLHVEVKRTFVTEHSEQLSENFSSKSFTAVLWKKSMKQSLHLSITLFMLHSSYLLLSCGRHADLCVLSGSLLWPCFQHKTEREIEPLPPQMCSGSSSVASVSISAINFRLPD